MARNRIPFMILVALYAALLLATPFGAGAQVALPQPFVFAPREDLELMSHVTSLHQGVVDEHASIPAGCYDVSARTSDDHRTQSNGQDYESVFFFAGNSLSTASFTTTATTDLPTLPEFGDDTFYTMTHQLNRVVLTDNFNGKLMARHVAIPGKNQWLGYNSVHIVDVTFKPCEPEQPPPPVLCEQTIELTPTAWSKWTLNTETQTETRFRTFPIVDANNNHPCDERIETETRPYTPPGDELTCPAGKVADRHGRCNQSFLVSVFNNTTPPPASAVCRNLTVIDNLGRNYRSASSESEALANINVISVDPDITYNLSVDGDPIMKLWNFRRFHNRVLELIPDQKEYVQTSPADDSVHLVHNTIDSTIPLIFGENANGDFYVDVCGRWVGFRVLN